jgi:hypothetical protein
MALLRSVLQLLDTANVIPSAMILFILEIETIRSSETWVPTRATRRHIPDYVILYSHRSENLKSYVTQY